MKRAIRHRRPLSLLLIDVDRFKSINDEWGHLAGDHVLREIADLVRDTVRTDSCFARYGGEEFAMVLPECDRKGAVITAERLRGSIEHHEFGVGGQVIPVTVSVGVAVIRGSMSDPVQLFHEADERLYEAKHAGRNRVAVAPDLPPAS